MRPTQSLFAVVALASALAGCGESSPATVGPVDTTQAPAELAMTCDHGIGVVAFQSPCLVGQQLGGGNEAALGVHEVECRLATSAQPVAWAFLMSLAEVAAKPDAPVMLPGSFATMSPTSGQLVDIAGRRAGVSTAAGSFTFSRLDPSNRAFIARFAGTVVWKDEAGATFSCDIDAPFWGAPGGFL